MATYYLRSIETPEYVRTTPMKAKDINDLRRKLCKDRKRKIILVYTRPEGTNASLSGAFTILKDGTIYWDVRGNATSVYDVDPRTGKLKRGFRTWHPNPRPRSRPTTSSTP